MNCPFYQNERCKIRPEPDKNFCIGVTGLCPLVNEGPRWAKLVAECDAALSRAERAEADAIEQRRLREMQADDSDSFYQPQIEALEADLARLRADLLALVPGGSEFMTQEDGRFIPDAKACLDWIRERMHNYAHVAGERNRLRAVLDAVDVEDLRLGARACKERAPHYDDGGDIETVDALDGAAAALRTLATRIEEVRKNG